MARRPCVQPCAVVYLRAASRAISRPGCPLGTGGHALPAKSGSVRYLDFEVEVSPVSRTGRRFRVSVVGSPGGNGVGDFVLPFTATVLQDRLRQIEDAVVKTAPTHREDGVKSFGSRVFEQFFRGEVRTCWDKSWQSIDTSRRLTR